MGNGPSSKVWVGSGDDRHRDFAQEYDLKQQRKADEAARDLAYDRDQWKQSMRSHSMGGRSSTAHTSVVTEPQYPGKGGWHW